MNWSTIVAVLLLGYGVGMWLLWSVVRDTCVPVGIVRRGVDRYQKIKSK